ncbi:hypothetical protein D1007_60482 [Hordeum vulgare]|nr:hypothetical protein D1007_60482 [Hordeum vulgare]
MAASPFSSSTGKSQGKEDDLGDFFDKLDLHEDEFDDVVVEEDAPELLEEIRWVALVRVHTSIFFSQAAFYKDMRAAWNCSQQVRFRPIGPNLFVVQVYCLRDWDRITQHGPWLFRNMAILLAPYDGFTKIEDVLMVYMPIWLQIHRLSDGYCRHDLIVKLLRSAGEVLQTRIKGNSRGDYIRVRVNHDIRKPLTKFVSIVKDKSRHIFAVRYEKLAKFCSACGVIGHDHKVCGDGVFEETDLKFGAYLYADQLKSSPRTFDQESDMELDKSSRKRLNDTEANALPDAEKVAAPTGRVLLLTDSPLEALDEPEDRRCKGSPKYEIMWEPDPKLPEIISRAWARSRS